MHFSNRYFSTSSSTAQSCTLSTAERLFSASTACCINAEKANDSCIEYTSKRPTDTALTVGRSRRTSITDTSAVEPRTTLLKAHKRMPKYLLQAWCINVARLYGSKEEMCLSIHKSSKREVRITSIPTNMSENAVYIGDANTPSNRLVSIIAGWMARCNLTMNHKTTNDGRMATGAMTMTSTRTPIISVIRTQASSTNGGNNESIISKSLPKRFNVRPVGVASNHPMGASKTRLNACSCNIFAVRTDPRMNKLARNIVNNMVAMLTNTHANIHAEVPDSRSLYGSLSS
mmetsp:Transcript_65533/g.103778  ORF Transcript_65533/g.103778 Transcript_65533/m.103778 type:complete len:288 (+) Transcript_65533:884-1747(+)